MLTVEQAHTLAHRAHGSARTRLGGLFIDHVRRVAKRVEGDPDQHAVVAAWLHDSVEKGSLSWEELWEAGADRRLIEVVDALTERDDEDEEDYLARAAANPLALRIKRADILDKLDPANLFGLSNGSLAAIQARARQRLELLERLAADTGS
jgi:(p)ppGpp synthase/HD superfamily hydrolase